MAKLGKEQLYFNAIKENRGSYFVEYRPPVGNSPFATLNVVYPGSYELTEVRRAMQAEMDRWLARYPVPLMTWGWDVAENIIRPNGPADDACLIGWRVPGTDEFASSWKIKEIPTFLNGAKNLPDLRTIYKGIPFKTDLEVKANAQKQFEKTRKQNFVLKIILVLWVAVIPATWASAQHFGPHWLELAVYIFALWQAFRAARKLFGRAKLTRSEEEKAEKERKMAHYYYHCERNPDGFAKLKAENFGKDLAERTRKEVEELAKMQPPPSDGLL